MDLTEDYARRSGGINLNVKKEKPKQSMEQQRADPEIVETSDKQKKAEGDKKKTLIYCGPTIQSIPLQQFATFRGELPKTMDEHFKKCPELKYLFVSATQFPKAKGKLNVKGSRESQLYQKALQYVRRG